MSRPTFQDWAMWGLVGSIEDCAEDTRDRMQRFVQLRLSRAAAKWPQHKGQFREYFGGDTESERSVCRARCGGRFDAHVTAKRKKMWLLGRQPKAKPPTYEDYATKWSTSAAWIIRTMFNEDMLPEIQKIPSLNEPANPDDPGGATRGDHTPDSKIAPDEEAMLADDRAVLHARLLQLELSDRERLVLWASYNQKNYCGQAMHALAGVGREQCSQCKIRLRERLRQAVLQMYEPEKMPVALIEALTDWAWWTLAEFHGGIDPTREAGGTIIWRHAATDVFIRPEKQGDGPFTWITVTTEPVT